MLYREIIAVCSHIHTKHINTLCGQNVELLNVKLVVVGFKPQNQMRAHHFHNKTQTYKRVCLHPLIIYRLSSNHGRCRTPNEEGRWTAIRKRQGYFEEDILLSVQLTILAFERWYKNTKQISSGKISDNRLTYEPDTS